MNQTMSFLLGGGGAVGLAYAVVALVRTVFNRKIINATAADQLAGSAVEMIDAVRRDAATAIAQARTDAATAIAQARTDAATSVAAALQDVASARRDSDEARRDAAEARREATAARKEAVDSNQFMRRVITELYRPDASIERLRRLVNDNGNGDALAMNGIRH
jgi:hypothetical protein